MFQDRHISLIIKISIIIFIIFFSILILNTLKNRKLNQEIEKKEPVLSLVTDSNIFKVDSVLLYSSANALNNQEMQKDYWDLNLYQYNDMAITIDNHVSISGTTQKNTIKEMYIDNISYPRFPDKGNPKLYYKNSNLFGVGVIDIEKLISDKLIFNVISSNDSEVKDPSFYSDCSNPILLSSINEEIVPNFIRRNTKSEVTFDGTLLLDAQVLLSNIEYSVSFSIHIINNLDEEYICNLIVPIKLRDESEVNTLHDGSYENILTDLSTSKFYKLEK
jgi:hypothetical protein